MATILVPSSSSTGGLTRLDLVRRLRQLAGVGAGSTGNGPVTTIDQTGEYKRLVDWIDAAWNLIQIEHKWDFLWESAQIGIAAGDYYTAGTIAAHRYEQDSGFLGTSRMVYRPWQRFREEYPISSIEAGTASGSPSVWSIRPDKAFVVNALASEAIVISVERYRNGTAMTADDDEPSLPNEHRLMIVYRALIEYANFDEAGVTRATAQSKYEEHLAALGLHELPQWEFGGPLA